MGTRCTLASVPASGEGRLRPLSPLSKYDQFTISERDGNNGFPTKPSGFGSGNLTCPKHVLRPGTAVTADEFRRDDKYWFDHLVLRRDDGELTSLTMDEYTQLKQLEQE